MQRRAKLFEAPEFGKGDMLFTLKEVTYTPETPRLKEPFTVKGKVELFKIPFLAPLWVQAKVTYPTAWWEEIIPIIGSPTVAEGQMAIGGDFEITFPRGFEREGEFVLEVNAYAGPTYSIDKMTLPPFPPVTTEKTTFIVGGEVPPEEVGFKEFRILSYSKNGGTPVTPPGVLELDVGDRCRVNVGFDHKNGAVTGKFHAAIWQKTLIDPHDEVLHADKSFTVPSSPDWEPWEGYIDIPITSAISPGTEYGLYVKIMGITGGDIFTEYLANVITIIGPPELGFELTKPTVSETPVDPGTPIDISCPVTSRCAEPVDATAKVIIYEGSIAPGHGDKLKEYDSGVFHINPGETKEVVITNHVTVVGTIDRRDVEVEVYVEGRKIKESEWDDVFKVIQPKELQTLEVDITPTEGGYVTTEPKATEGHPVEKWYNNDTGKFEYDTRVRVTAHPNEGYEFDHWSDEIEGGVSYSNPEYVKPMTEHRAVKAHFREIEIELELLEVKIDPAGGGYVTVSPTPESGTEHYWYFPHGTTVYVTAHPASGYIFKSWSGEMKDTTAITAPVYPMTEKRTITAHFEEEYVPPPPEEYTLTIRVEPYGGGTTTPSAGSHTYTKGYVTLTAYPATDYEFDHWSGDVSGYSKSVSVYMDRDKDVVANFKAVVPPPTKKVSFTVKGDGFPFATSYWKLYHYDLEGNIWQDYTLHRPGDIIRVRDVQSAGKLSCHCCNMFTGEWSEQYYSVEFAAIDDEDYKYDIASGIVYYR